MLKGLFGRKKEHVDFEETAMPVADALYGAALRLLRDPQLAEDLVQETLLRAYRFWHQFEPGTNIKAWLFRIQTNLFINHYRKHQGEQKVLDDRQVDDLLERYSEPAQVTIPLDLRESFLKEVVGDEVLAALERLPVEFRLAVLLADMQDFSYKEIAEMLDCPVGTVMSRLHRGRKLLQAQLYQYALDRGIISGPPAEEEAEVESLEAFRQRKAAGGER